MLGKIFLWLGVISFCIVVIASLPLFFGGKEPLALILPINNWLKCSALSTVLAIAFMIKQIAEKE